MYLFTIIIGGILVLFIYLTRLASNEIISPSNKIHREVGLAKDLSAPLSMYLTYYVRFVRIERSDWIFDIACKSVVCANSNTAFLLRTSTRSFWNELKSTHIFKTAILIKQRQNDLDFPWNLNIKLISKKKKNGIQRHSLIKKSTRALHEYKNAFGQLLEERRERGEIYS